MLKRDDGGIAHIVGLSGGKDSTAMSLCLLEQEPRPYNYIFTPTGDELPDMVEHWQNLQQRLDMRFIPLTSGKSLNGLISHYNALPNPFMRWCTRQLKIEPTKVFLLSATPAVSYVGLRADELERGGIYGEIEGVTQDYPFQRWGWEKKDVLEYLKAKKVSIPRRTDCARCYHQQLGEWWNLWREHPSLFEDAAMQEKTIGHTFRSDKRDSWPAELTQLKARFDKGDVPTRSKSADFQLSMFVDEDNDSKCRVCSL